MKKSTLISLIALLVAAVGVLIALVAYFKRKRCVLCDDFDEDMIDDCPDCDYYSTDLEEDDEGNVEAASNTATEEKPLGTEDEEE